MNYMYILYDIGLCSLHPSYQILLSRTKCKFQSAAIFFLTPMTWWRLQVRDPISHLDHPNFPRLGFDPAQAVLHLKLLAFPFISLVCTDCLVLGQSSDSTETFLQNFSLKTQHLIPASSMVSCSHSTLESR